MASIRRTIWHCPWPENSIPLTAVSPLSESSFITGLVYHISSFERRGVYLILGLVGSASIRMRRLFQRSKQNKMKSCFNSKQYFLNHAV